MLTTTEVAKRLGVTRKTVLRMVRRGDLTAVRISPKDFRVAETELDRFLAENIVRTDAERAS